MQNPTIGFRIISLLLGLHELDHGIRCNSPEKALEAVSGMINTLRKLRRAIRLDINTEVWVHRKGRSDEIKSNKR